MVIRHKAVFGLFTLLVVTLAIHSACPAKDTIAVTDMANRRVIVPQSPDRIICVAPGTLRLICYLGAQDKVVGVEQFEKRMRIGRPYWLANPQLAKLPSIGPGGPKTINSEPDLEAVLKVKPEVIFISYMDAAKADALQKKLNIPVVVITYGRFATFDPVLFQSLRVMGKILNKDKRAEEIVAFIDNSRKDLLKRVERVADSKKPSAYVGGIGYRGYQGIESTDASYVPLEWVNARNVAKEIQKSGHLFIDKEQLLSWNPDIIFIDAGGLRLVQEDFRKKPEFYEGLKAVKTKTVYLLLPVNWYVTNIGTAIADAYACGKTLYPGEFSDVVLPDKADAIYRFFVGKPVYQQMQKSFGVLGGHVTFR
ncbi:MAG: iron ABC transporter substrate-binding protein [Deltaproteobacteria bacterium]